MLILSKSDVDRVVMNLTTEALELSMAAVFIVLSKSEGIVLPPRIAIPVANHTALCMPSRMSNIGTGIKIVSVPASLEDTRGLPGTTLVLNDNTGGIRAVVNARNLTALRNAAGSLLVTRLVGPANPTRFMAFGAGAQIKAHIDLHLRSFESIIECYIVNRSTSDRLANLVNTLQSRFPEVMFTSLISSSPEIERIMRNGVDIICAATPSTTPLFPSAWVQPGTHLNLVGSYKPTMHEVDGDLIRRSRGSLIVDSRDMCATEAGELIAANIQPDEMVEIGEFVRIGSSGRPERIEGVINTSDISIFKSVGISLQDVAIASVVVTHGEAMGLGVRVEDYDR